MLIHQSLNEIADSPVNEQIAYLLVERAKLLDDLQFIESSRTDSVVS